MEPIIYLRDCIFDEECDPESNIEIDLQTRKLWFTKSGIKSISYDLDSATPLLSSTNQPYTLYQLYLFTSYIKDNDWAEYIVEVGMAKEDSLNNNYSILPIAESANTDCDLLYNYLSGNAHIHNGLNISTQIPKELKIEIIKNKRLLNDNLSSEPPNKKQKLNNTNNILKNEILIIEELSHTHNNGDSLFTENYDLNNLEMIDNNKPFWMSLPDPNPIDINNNITINWKDDYRKRIRESSTRNSILNSLNNKSFGEIAKEFPKISRSLQKLIQSGGTKGSIRFKSSNAERIRKSRTEAPIIIVPYSNNSLLTFSNCLPFLQENKYIYTNNKSLQQQIIKKNKNLKNGNSATRINLQMKSYLDSTNKKPAIFEIRSSSSFTKNTANQEWNRIAAIFVIGKAWQFKKWINGWKKPEEIFSKTAGFYMHFKDDPPNQIVSKWRVNYLPIMRNQRHDDARIAKQFWSKLYDHLKSKHRNKKLYF